MTDDRFDFTIYHSPFTIHEPIMLTPYGHLSYCTNIHPGENWNDHFAQLQQHVPQIKNSVSPHAPFGIGLRLANVASKDLAKPERLHAFKAWLQQHYCYVFTMNGFPYGGFHNTVVKADVHTPDWTTDDRVDYTIRLAQILAQLLPDGEEGSISTNPLSYRYWHNDADYDAVFKTGTTNLLRVVAALIGIKKATGKIIHINIEPEPDGMMETGPEFIHWFNHYLLPLGGVFLQNELGLNRADAEAALRTHVQLCFDICHFAIGFEDHLAVLQQLKKESIGVGKIQISAALRRELPADSEKRKAIIAAFAPFNEPVYLHQVIAKEADGSLTRYRDLPDALQTAETTTAVEWRAHYHVPLFAAEYGALHSTQPEIATVLKYQAQQPFSAHMEVETYTWDVLPDDLKLPIADSIVRELQWVLAALDSK
ncbi:metabolite traffic protein EboE [Paracnuella aquatica]|uniref:metabolite traffic protein EboE n=1 Tax=Paracnuella aquatica TaxID=2268757 RepID=UPI001F4D89ED|nr:metabolite traffic protein EboE [Paracnuella aquatica]